MIYETLLPAVKAHLETEISFLDAHQVQCHTDERVHPVKSKPFNVGLYPGFHGPGDSPEIEGGIDLEVSFFVGITQRVGHVPVDRHWEKAYASTGGMVKAIRSVYVAIRGKRWNLACAVNALLETAGVDWRVIRPFRYTGGPARVQEVSWSHFNGDPSGNGQKAFGFFVPMEFSGRVMARNYDASHVLNY